MTTEEKLQHFYEVSMESARMSLKRLWKNTALPSPRCSLNIKKINRKMPATS